MAPVDLLFASSGACACEQNFCQVRTSVFEGMWHFFWENPELPESREAMTALARFLNRHLE
jgi:acetyl esterase/lipase